MYWVAFKSEMVRTFIKAKRYFFDTLSRILITYLVFIAIFYGLQYMTGPSLDGKKLDELLIGYIMWTFAVSAYFENSFDISEESTIGTLEQLYLAPIGFHIIIFFRMISGYLFSIFYNVSVLYLTMLTTGHWIELPIFHFLLIITLAIPSIYGIGYIFGGLALVYKKIENSLNVVQFALILLVALPAWPIQPSSFLPFAAGAHSINRMVVEKIDFPLWWYFFIAANSLVYFLIGMSIFKIFETRAKKFNLLGQY
ncbi:MAG: hypothetical protein DRQ88_13415 [Epsilonproteobacteria bacterium]|nr:MAG: hypothetical protein DRQ89_09245 [Campylobacterota bacterium]RLA62611.1 MAG: hypothetical protein DRQ88_13415 [Campylobacterota bacterium]